MISTLDFPFAFPKTLGMNGTVPLTQSQIEEAIKEYVERAGWNVSGTVVLSHLAGEYNTGGATYSASVSVSPGKVKGGK